MRLSIAAFFAVWAIEKILSPDVAESIFANFYGLDLGTGVYPVLGALQLAVIIAFAGGLFRFWTYGALLLMHTVSTLSTWQQLLNPYDGPNHLFWAAVPVLGALIALFILRDRDTLLVVKRR